MYLKQCNKVKYEVEYTICIPGGNNTALVYGTNYTQKQKKIINDAIMKKHSDVEQVGFINLDRRPELQMAGGEFCGNATRSVASLYLNNTPGNLQIIVNSKDIINAGVYENGKAWCEIPYYKGTDVITEKEQGIFIVKMNGMVCIIIQEDVAGQYLEHKEDLKNIGMNFINKYNLENNEAVGIMFCERKEELLQINPIVWVKEINTLFYETACGSGTIAVCIVETFKNKKSQKLDILQPSGMIITSEVIYQDNKIKKAIISGEIKKDTKKYLIEIEEE